MRDLKYALMFHPILSGELEPPVIPQAGVFVIDDPSHRPDRVRTFWPYLLEPYGKLKKVVYTLSSDQQVELGCPRVVCIFDTHIPDGASEEQSIYFFHHKIYGRAVVLAGAPMPYPAAHTESKHSFFDTFLEAKHVMEWLIDAQDWWKGRHHDRTIGKENNYSTLSPEGSEEMEEDFKITWSHYIQ